MERQYESLKMDIMRYVALNGKLESAALGLERILKDIQRKLENEKKLAALALKLVIQRMLEPIRKKGGKLYSVLEFFKNWNEGPEYCGRDNINLAFETRSKTLYRIQAEMVTLLQNAKNTLEGCYRCSLMYTPDVEVPRESKYEERRTEGGNWTSFCRVVDELTEVPRSRDGSPERRDVSTGVSEGKHASDAKLVQLLNDFKLLWCDLHN